MPLLVENEKSAKQPVLLLKRANVTTGVVRMQSTVGTLCEGRVRNAVFRASEARAMCVHRAEPHVCEGEGIGAHTLLKIHPCISY